MKNDEKGPDADGQSAIWYYKWFDNDVLISGQTSPTLDLTVSGLDRNDEIICEIIGSDGTDNTAPLNSSNSAIIQNFIPTHSTPLLTSSFATNFTNENLTCFNQNTFDGDENDNVTNIYNWFKNNAPLNNLYLPFEINANDFSTSGNDGIRFGGNFVSGILGRALAFNGTNEHINITDDDNSLDFTTKKTWEIWFKRNALGLETIFDKTNSNNNLTNYKLFFDINDFLVFTFSIPGLVTGDLSFPTITQEDFNQGNHSNTYFNTTNNAVQLNISQGFASGKYTSKIFDADPLASWNNISWTSNAFGELPDNQEVETRFAEGNADMTGNVLLMHMNDNVAGASQTIEDTSGNANDGTTFGDTDCTVAGKLNTGCSFDGTGDYVDAGSPVFLDDESGSISVWAKVADLDAQYLIFASSVDGSADDELFVSVRGDLAGDPLELFVLLNGDTNLQARSPSSAVSANVWHNYVFTSDGSTVKMYIDSLEQSLTIVDGSNTGQWFADATDSNKFVISGVKRASITAPWSGKMDEVSVWNRTLSAPEILDMYKRGILNLNLSVRSCDDTLCATEEFVNITSISPQDLSVIDEIGDKQFFQYKFKFTTEDTAHTPKLFNVTVEVASFGSGVGETTLISTSTITDTNFHYAAVTYDNDTASNNFNLYIDGILNKTKTDHNTSQQKDNNLHIARNYQGTNYTNENLIITNITELNITKITKANETEQISEELPKKNYIWLTVIAVVFILIVVGYFIYWKKREME